MLEVVIAEHEFNAGGGVAEEADDRIIEPVEENQTRKGPEDEEAEEKLEEKTPDYRTPFYLDRWENGARI